MTEHEDPKERKFQGTIRPLAETDLLQIKPILETWIRFPVITGELITEEVEEVLNEMKKSLQEDAVKKFLIAEGVGGEVMGVMGYQKLREEMNRFAQTDVPAELINANVSDEHRGNGVGTALIAAIETSTKKEGYKELLLNSGPRYKDTAWEFYNKRFGQPVGELKDFYGPDFSAPVWRKVL